MVIEIFGSKSLEPPPSQILVYFPRNGLKTEIKMTRRMKIRINLYSSPHREKLACRALMPKERRERR